MGLIAASKIDAWLRNGGLVITASDRAARAISSAFHRARQAEGISAWIAPNILDWKTFVRSAWQERTLDGRLVLNPAQEQALWAQIVGSNEQLATLLEAPRHRLASLAMEAHELLCFYAPQFLRASNRSGWQQDAAAFSSWIGDFDQACRADNLVSPSRLPLELIALFESPGYANPEPKRPAIVLAGFDRILPQHRKLLNAWGTWHIVAPSEETASAQFWEAPDNATELAACALWCKSQLTKNSRARLLVVSQNIAGRRGEIERAFLRHASLSGSSLLEFSLGVPLAQVELAQTALLLLRWLSGPIAEHELDWLFSTGRSAFNPQETNALQAHMRTLRRRGLQQPSWTLTSFNGRNPASPLPDAWVQRINQARLRLLDFSSRKHSPFDWAELVPQLLQTAGWPGGSPLSSAEFQEGERWQKAIETCGSLGFNGHLISWQDFLSNLVRILDATLFSPESREAPVLIAGPAESAGLTADAVWFLGATESAWPGTGATHPLLPLGVQRDTSMPHATPQLDWELALAITNRLQRTAPEIRISFSKQDDGAEARPSRLITQLAGSPRQIPSDFNPPPAPPPITISIQDASQIPFPPGNIAGGASVLTFQSQCPFKAFANARLGADHWERAEAGLSDSQRGQLLHAVLHSVWAGKPNGIRTLADLRNLNSIDEFVNEHVRRSLQEEINSGLRQRLPRRYLELEEQRLTQLVTEWLKYESTRIDFEVVETEAGRNIPVAGLSVKLRIDRVDQLIDGSLLVIDYKSGNVSPKSWELPRPDDVQLPLYGGFALDGILGGLVFAKVRTGDQAFAGCVADPTGTLIADLNASCGLMKKPLCAETLIDWRDHIEQLARAFLAGRADVDPRDYPKTCEHCGLQSLCRIQENHDVFESDEENDETEDAFDE